MAKLRNPLHSEAASGKLDEETVLCWRYGKTYSRRHVVPKQPNTKAQKETKGNFAWAMRQWQRWLKEDEREAWRGYSRKAKRVDPLTLGTTHPLGHTLFLRSAIWCRRAGFAPPRLPPSSPSPQSVRLVLSPRGKGLLIQWDPLDSGIVRQGAKPDFPGAAPKLELCLAVTDAWRKPWESLYTTLALVPLAKARHLYTPVRPGKRYSFSSRVLTSDGQASLPFRISLILE
jgi:hypothetical protein